jgi:anaerobic magnesium-protoporphyrin IX monomethyl ester cyclase
MLSIAVCHSYFLRLDPKQLARAKPYPPLATLQVAGALREAGHRISFFDAMLADGLAAYEQLLQGVRPDVVLLYEDNYNFLTKMCLSRMRSAGLDMIRRARELGARVIVAGSDATDEPAPYLAAGADVVLIGEGLHALEQLLSRIAAQPDIGAAALADGIFGIAILAGDEVRRVGRAPSPRKALAGMLPAWDLIDMQRYRAVWRKAHGYFSLNMAASRGCSFRCAWCAKPIWGDHYLQREPLAVAQELSYLKRSFAPDHIWFADDIFGFRIDWVDHFAAALRADDGVLPFTIQTRADLVSERMAAALKDAGCREAWLGAESGSQRVLDAMNKGLQVGEVLRARARLQAAGIRVGFFIQLGYPGEQLEDILATRELISTAAPDDVGVSVAYPLPGTKFYELVKAQLGLKNHWQDSDDLAMMFHGAFESGFYRSVRDLLHEEVRIRAGAGSRGAVRALGELEMRWHELIAHAPAFRSVAADRLEPAAGGC